MICVGDIDGIDFESVPVDYFWNTGDNTELKMHRIHAYPAKFPAFITTKALDYAYNNNLEVSKIADIFCGCGTVAFEAMRSGIDFWGCDINPVATMIAKAKSRKYNKEDLELYYKSIIECFSRSEAGNSYETANPRLQYWYDKEHYEDLVRLKKAIYSSTPIDSDYRLLFTCAFSNILKATSKWLTKSIKPQVDPEKEPTDVLTAFKAQCRFMVGANEKSDISGNASAEIVTGNILDVPVQSSHIDMVITSPPYVTSYEYADLHQLSSLWLDYAHDYRQLREGSIGSLHHSNQLESEWDNLNSTGQRVVSALQNLPKCRDKPKAHHVAKYFLDMQKVASKTRSMLRPDGIALFVIGNTEYKGIRVDNAKHLAESLYQSGFSEVLVTKRKIRQKILTPYRDSRGRFTTDNSGRKVYSEEFILVGRR
ncbi:hypothetical protein ES707_01907 [subsurface metagenome]